MPFLCIYNTHIYGMIIGRGSVLPHVYDYSTYKILGPVENGVIHQGSLEAGQGHLQPRGCRLKKR